MSATDPASAGSALVRFGRFIRFSHTVFALPFALAAMLLAADGLPPLDTVGWILVCMVTARTMAMIFNRLADWEIDQRNPRTAERHRLVSKRAAQVMFLVSALGFVVGAAMLNELCLALAPVAVALVCFYSFCKRFTAGSHFFLGLALSAAPMGAWAAVQGTLLHPVPWLLAFAVLCWVFGFDLIYALLDLDFDRKEGLHSFPARYGAPAALVLARLLHVVAVAAFALVGLVADGLGWGYAVACVLAAAALVVEHRLSASGDPVRINRAFFQVNAVVSLLILVGVAVDVLVKP
jgi:4-hydroxybenzoate polyprenyltransferase